MPDPASTPVLTVRGLCFAYAPDQAPLFTDWSADLLPGITRIEGESGKTTLLRLLANELRGRGDLNLLGTRLDSDEAAYRRLLGELATLLRGWTRRELSRQGYAVGEAEDIVQETLIAVHLKRGSWDKDRPFLPWLRAVSRHKLIDSLRRYPCRPQADQRT